MFQSSLQQCVLAAALLATPLFSQAAFSGVTDPANDLLPTFGGSATATDLDVLSATVIYDSVADMFKLSATMNGTVGSTATGLYVWGVNRGTGVASFAANGIDGVRFDRVILLRPDGTGSIGGGAALPAGSVSILGNTITGLVSGSLLASTGFNKLDYTWNLWPRDTRFAGFAAISDFAPDNSSFTSTPGPVPEPQTLALMLGGLGAAGWLTRQRGATKPRG
jgi:PEP-CTERM motif